MFPNLKSDVTASIVQLLKLVDPACYLAVFPGTTGKGLQVLLTTGWRFLRFTAVLQVKVEHQQAICHISQELSIYNINLFLTYLYANMQ